MWSERMKRRIQFSRVLFVPAPSALFSSASSLCPVSIVPFTRPFFIATPPPIGLWQVIPGVALKALSSTELKCDLWPPMLSEALVSGPAAPDSSGSVDEAPSQLPSIDCLPYEIKKEIIRLTSVLPWTATECREAQQSLSLVNQEFAALVNPFLWSAAESAIPTTEKLSFFLRQIIPRHGRHVRRLLFGNREWERVDRPLTSGTPSGSRAIAADIILSLPSLSHFAILSNFRLDGLLDTTVLDAAIALGGRLRSLSIVSFNRLDPSYLAAFLHHFVNLEELELVRVGRSESDDFLVALTNLTRLRELSLRRVPLRPTAHLRWPATLRTLCLKDCDDLLIRDTQIFVDAFSSTLTDLTISIADNDLEPPDLDPFPPSHFPHLENLRLDWYPAEESPFLTSLERSPVRYIKITIRHARVFRRTHADHLVAALAAFRPTLEELQVNMSLAHLEPGWDTLSKELAVAFGEVARWCKEQVPEVVFSGNGQEQLQPFGMAWSIE